MPARACARASPQSAGAVPRGPFHLSPGAQTARRRLLAGGRRTVLVEQLAAAASMEDTVHDLPEPTPLIT